MSDLISRSELLSEFSVNSNGDKIPEYDIDNFPVTIEVKNVKEMIRKQPTVSEQEIRSKAIEELKELVRGHKYTNAENGATVEEMLKDENTEKKYAWYLSNNACCDWMLNKIDEIAEQMKEVE